MDLPKYKRTSRIELATAVRRARHHSPPTVTVLDARNQRLVGDNADYPLSQSTKELCRSVSPEETDYYSDSTTADFTDEEDACFLAEDEEELECHNIGGDLSAAIFGGPEQNTNGWRIREVCAMILFVAKNCGLADANLEKFIKIFALMANTTRHPADVATPFPRSYHRLKSVLGIDPTQEQNIVYICPATSTGKRRGEYEKVEERCGWRLREASQIGFYKCDACDSRWDKKFLDRDGNHFATVPVHALLRRTMARFGKFTAPLRPPAAEETPHTMRDVTDGQRFRDMKIEKSDLVFLLHSDGAAISKSTSKKLYLTFLQCVNIPLHIRMPIWSLQSVWVGEELPKDRECFLIELSRQLQETQPGNPSYHPVPWTDSSGTQHTGDAYPLAYLADTPERSALNGQLPHCAGQACLYCLQISKCINHRMCYEYLEETEMKSHANVIAQAAKWEESSFVERKRQLIHHETQGFKRPSVISKWKNFDMIKGFAIDVMHQFDEGVARFFLEQLMERDTVLNTWKEASKMDRIYLEIIVAGHHNRNLRSLKKWRTYKAHELRFFVQHALPFVTRDFVHKKFYKVFCLASRIAYQCTCDSISSDDIDDLKSLCGRFMVAFQEAFGIEQMKYSIHLVSHLWYAVKLYGPLHTISCYGPENQIGKIARKIKGMNNTTKHIMNNFIILSQVTDMLAVHGLEGDDTDHRVMSAMKSIQGQGDGLFSLNGQNGTCIMAGRPQVFSGDSQTDAFLLYRISQSTGLRLNSNQVFYFRRARTETGIYVRPYKAAGTIRRNESVIVDDAGNVMQVDNVIGVVNEAGTAVIATLVTGLQMTSAADTGSIPKIGTKSVLVPHISCLRITGPVLVRETARISRQMVILCIDHLTKDMLLSPPSNKFRPT